MQVRDWQRERRYLNRVKEGWRVYCEKKKQDGLFEHGLEVASFFFFFSWMCFRIAHFHCHCQVLTPVCCPELDIPLDEAGQPIPLLYEVHHAPWLSDSAKRVFQRAEAHIPEKRGMNQLSSSLRVELLDLV